MSEDRITVPLTILTGWLGAGKTTLLRHLLEQAGPHAKKIAVVQNEFSGLGVENALRVQDDTGAFGEYLELANGCVCCSVKSDLLMTLETLLRKQKFDSIVLECSGMADPGPLARMFWVDGELESELALDAIVVLVDGVHLHKNLHQSSTESKQVRQQIAYADRIILNKMDLVKEEDVSGLESAIRDINPSAPIQRAVKSHIDPTFFTNVKAFERIEASVVVDHHHHQHLEGEECEKKETDGRHVHLHGGVPCSEVHDRSITNIILDLPNIQVDENKIRLWLADLLWEYEGAIEPEEEKGKQALQEKKAKPDTDKGGKQGGKKRKKRRGKGKAQSGSKGGSGAKDVEKEGGEKAGNKKEGGEKAGNKKEGGEKGGHGGERKTGGEMEEEVRQEEKWTKPDIFRIKGILWTSDPNPVYLQAVQQLFDITPSASSWESERRTRIVIIGRHLDRAFLEQGLRKCTIDPN